MDDSNFHGWATENYNCWQLYKQPVVSFQTEEEVYFNDFDCGAVSIPPMQRFMVDQYPLPSVMLHANIPPNGQYERHYDQQWPSADCFRNISPDRTSSGNTSQNTQDELPSPQMYHTAPYSHSSPMEHYQVPLAFDPIEQFQGGSHSSETRTFQKNISLRELEYEPPLYEAVVEEVDHVAEKQEAICNKTDDNVKEEVASVYLGYADSAIEHSVRDAQSVEPVDLTAEESASDSDYSPSLTRSRKRRRSTISNSSSNRTQKRRCHHVRKDSYVTSSAVSGKSDKKTRRTSKASGGSLMETNSWDNDQRPFPCPLAAYGCTSNFPSKNEWKRHVSTQHIKLAYWRCDICAPTIDPNNEHAVYYNDFNRKDLFTQHLRRMHAAPKDKSACSHADKFPVTEENLAEVQTRCHLPLRCAPQQSSCLFCDRTFSGATSWDERMEHVGHHLEKDQASGTCMRDPATWRADKELEKYLVEEGLVVRDAKGWGIGNGDSRKQKTAVGSSEGGYESCLE
ncbi:c2h2 finger domain-containing [Pyrenophora seminiperda CCB06]|uniref:C2h2 finger domain-containing n=1 Tax=Pyrenophora seminiperda CCB06 TaxID=1302712 RepID=A0A3M7LXE1_9PLEO|nr:c2h2 finger domain-containing [Pyrenophora seminiperda CCB06]